MMFETWKLGEIVRKYGGAVQTGPFGSQLHQSDYCEIGTPVVMPKDIIDDRIDTTSIAKIDDVLLNRLSRHILEEGDIVYPRRGDLNKRAYVSDREVGWLCGTGCMKISVQGTPIYPKYLFYFLKRPDVVKYIENKAVGATMPNLSSSLLADLEISYPPFAQQQQITSILSAYDDLIDNNTRRIALLEESMRLLYREWFVRLRFPWYEQGKVVNGLPEGWVQSSLRELFPDERSTVKTGPFGSNLHAHDYREEGIPLLLIKHVFDGRIDETNLDRIGEHKWNELAEYRLQSGDIVVTRVGRVGDSAYIFDRYAGWFFSGQMLRVRLPSNDRLHPRFLASYYHLSSFKQQLEGSATGATRLSLNTQLLASIPFIVPSMNVQKQFIEVITPVDEMILNLRSQNWQLTQARDLLLPRLMSGGR